MNTVKIFILIFISSLSISAQDMIYKTDETIISSKVLEVGASTIKYKLFGNSLDNVFEIPKNDIHHIIYQNGIKEFYNTSPKRVFDVHEDTQPSMNNNDFKRNIIALNCFEIAFTNFSISYERISVSGKSSVKIPVSFGLGGRPNTNNYVSQTGTTQFLQNKIFSGGVEFNLYPLGQTRNTFYLGISASAGSFYYYKTVYATQYYNGYYPSQYSAGQDRRIGSHYAGLIHLVIGTKIGLGFKRENTLEVDYTLPTAQFDFNLAYKF